MRLAIAFVNSEWFICQAALQNYQNRRWNNQRQLTKMHNKLIPRYLDRSGKHLGKALSTKEKLITVFQSILFGKSIT